MKKIIKSLLAISLITSSFTILAKDQNKEKIKIRAPVQKLEVLVRAIKPSFKPDEPIKFKVKGNQDFFLYIFAIDSDDESVTMMLPNKLQKHNKYKANITYTVPNAEKMEMVSDRPGQEKLVILTSAKYLSWNTKGYKEMGQYMNTNAERFNSQMEALSIRAAPNKRHNQQASQTQSQRANKDVIAHKLLIEINKK